MNPHANSLIQSTLSLAVRVGFEPTEPAKAQRFSRPPDSTALAPHRLRQSITSFIASESRPRTRRTPELICLPWRSARDSIASSAPAGRRLEAK